MPLVTVFFPKDSEPNYRKAIVEQTESQWFVDRGAFVECAPAVERGLAMAEEMAQVKKDTGAAAGAAIGAADTGPKKAVDTGPKKAAESK